MPYQCPKTPPCTVWLTEANPALGTWPDHLCEPTAIYSTFNYAWNAIGLPPPSEVGALPELAPFILWAYDWPLPCSAAARSERLAQIAARRPGVRWVPRLPQPFQWLGAVLELNLGVERVTLFAPVLRARLDELPVPARGRHPTRMHIEAAALVGPEGPRAWQFAAPPYLAVSQPAYTPRQPLQASAKMLADWYGATLAGQRPRGGHPFGTSAFSSRDDFISTMLSCYTNLGSRRFTEEHVGQYLDDHPQQFPNTPRLRQNAPRQFRRWCEEFGFANWAALALYLGSLSQS
jgi:hypothetical protein